MVISHHAHIPRGIEIYKGKPIYHGLGNFVTVNPCAASTRRRRRERLGDASAEVVRLRTGPRDSAVLNYLEHITREAGFGTRLCWDGDEVIILPE